MTRRLWFVAACVLAVGAWTGVQWLRSAYAVRHVEVSVTDAWCRDQPVDWSGTGARMETSRAMRCQFQVVVGNDSGRSVKLDAITAPFLGPDTGTVIRAASIAGQSPAGGRDAIINTTRVVQPHGVAAFTIVAVFNPAGCNDSGTLTFYDWPRVTAYSFANRREIKADFDLSFHNTIRTPGCRALEGQQ